MQSWVLGKVSLPMTFSEFEIERTAPIPSLEASVFNTKVSLLFGNDDIGEETKCFLSV